MRGLPPTIATFLPRMPWEPTRAGMMMRQWAGFIGGRVAGITAAERLAGVDSRTPSVYTMGEREGRSAMTYTTYDPVLDLLYREMADLGDAIVGAYEALAEERMSAYMGLGPDFAYQRFPAHDHIAKLERMMDKLEAMVAERMPVPKPVVAPVETSDWPF
jgi:hypothetical protein